MSPLNAATCTTISYTLWVEWYYIKNNYLTLRSKVKVPRRSLWYATQRLMVMHPHTKYHWPIWRQKCYGPDKKILLKKQLFDLEVKDQGPTKVITVRDTPPYGHAHTNYHPMNSFVGFIWIIWPSGQRSRFHEGHYGMQHTTSWSCTHIPIIIDLSRRQQCYGPDKKILFKKQLFDLEVKGQGSTKVITVRDTPPYGHAYTKYLSMNSFVGFIWIIWPWGQRSRSHEGHYSTRHTALWSCTHIPIIIDLPRKTKILWHGQENTI
jgi:hypothetical protein